MLSFSQVQWNISKNNWRRGYWHFIIDSCNFMIMSHLLVFQQHDITTLRLCTATNNMYDDSCQTMMIIVIKSYLKKKKIIIIRLTSDIPIVKQIVYLHKLLYIPSVSELKWLNTRCKRTIKMNRRIFFSWKKIKKIRFNVFPTKKKVWLFPTELFDFRTLIMPPVLFDITVSTCNGLSTVANEFSFLCLTWKQHVLQICYSV